LKGFTHFMTGIAIATCFGIAVRASLDSMSQIIILGGIFGYLPDFLDFQISRFLVDFDYEVDPTLERNIDPQRIADMFVEAIHKARDSGKTTRIKFNTMKLGADTWRQYGIMVDAEKKRIVVKVGPLVTTGKTALPGTEPPPEDAVGVAYYDAELIHTYDAWTYADIMSGPDYTMVPEDDGSIRLDFIAWHRAWSHSITAGLALAPLGVLLYLGLNSIFAGQWVFDAQMTVVAFMICLYGYWIHVIVDQFGVMGSNLFPPFTKRRSKGLGLFHSGLSIANFGTNWISVAVILYNLNYWAYERTFTTNILKYFALTTIIPLTCLALIRYAYLRHVEKSQPPQEESEGDLDYMEKMDEMMEHGTGSNV
jgi:membrane-bound metal-dependent hydrolase YbcI (DUF457 family)